MLGPPLVTWFGEVIETLGAKSYLWEQVNGVCLWRLQRGLCSLSSSLVAFCHKVKIFLCHTYLLPWHSSQILGFKQPWDEPSEVRSKVNPSVFRSFLSNFLTMKERCTVTSFLLPVLLRVFFSHLTVCLCRGFNCQQWGWQCTQFLPDLSWDFKSSGLERWLSV